MLAAALRLLKLAESIAAAAAYGVVAALLMIDVVGRELFAATFLGMQQLAVYGAIVAGFAGLTLATSDDAHLRPGFMDFAAGERGPQARRLGDFLSALFFACACAASFGFVLASMEYGDKAPVMYFPLWPLQLVIPYAFASAGLKHLIFALDPSLKPGRDAAAG